jgi:hypothetical protein
LFNAVRIISAGVGTKRFPGDARWINPRLRDTVATMHLTDALPNRDA